MPEVLGYSGDSVSGGVDVGLDLAECDGAGCESATTVKRLLAAAQGARREMERRSSRNNSCSCCCPLGLKAGFWFRLDRFLRLDHGGQEVVEVGGVDVADCDDAQVWCGGGVEGETGAGGGQCGEGGVGGSLGEEDGDLVLVDGEEKQGRGLIVEVG
jgi:hypothetical protein